MGKESIEKRLIELGFIKINNTLLTTRNFYRRNDLELYVDKNDNSLSLYHRGIKLNNIETIEDVAKAIKTICSLEVLSIDKFIDMKTLNKLNELTDLLAYLLEEENFMIILGYGDKDKYFEKYTHEVSINSRINAHVVFSVFEDDDNNYIVTIEKNREKIFETIVGDFKPYKDHIEDIIKVLKILELNDYIDYGKIVINHKTSLVKFKDDRWDYYIEIYKIENKKFKIQEGLDEDDSIDMSEINYSPEACVGYYLANYGENAYTEWKECTKGLDYNETEKFIDNALKDLCKEVQNND